MRNAELDQSLADLRARLEHLRARHAGIDHPVLHVAAEQSALVLRHAVEVLGEHPERPQHRLLRQTGTDRRRAELEDLGVVLADRGIGLGLGQPERLQEAAHQRVIEAEVLGHLRMRLRAQADGLRQDQAGELRQHSAPGRRAEVLERDPRRREREGQASGRQVAGREGAIGVASQDAEPGELLDALRLDAGARSEGRRVDPHHLARRVCHRRNVA